MSSSSSSLLEYQPHRSFQFDNHMIEPLLCLKQNSTSSTQQFTPIWWRRNRVFHRIKCTHKDNVKGTLVMKMFVNVGQNWRSLQATTVINHIQGQCHKIFDHFLGLKDSTWAPYEQAKTVSRNVSSSRRYLKAKFGNGQSDFADTCIVVEHI